MMCQKWRTKLKNSAAHCQRTVSCGFLSAELVGDEVRQCDEFQGVWSIKTSTVFLQTQEKMWNHRYAQDKTRVERFLLSEGRRVKSIEFPLCSGQNLFGTHQVQIFIRRDEIEFLRNSGQSVQTIANQSEPQHFNLSKRSENTANISDHGTAPSPIDQAKPLFRAHATMNAAPLCATQPDPGVSY